MPTAGDESWPSDDPTNPTGETQWELLQAPLGDDGVLSYPGSQAAQVYADGSGMLVKRRAGEAWFRGYYWRSRVEDPVTIAPNTAQYPRVDRIVLRHDPLANRTTTEVLQGSAATSATAQPAVPALTQTAGLMWEIPLAQVYVPAGAGTAGNAVQRIDASRVTDERRFRGLRLWQATNVAQLPTRGVFPWQEAVDVSGAKWRWNGSAWKQTRSQLDTGPTPWIGGVRHNTGSTNADLKISKPDSGGIYKVENGWVTGSCTVTLDAGSPPSPSSVRVSVPLPVNRTAHPTNSTLGSWSYVATDINQFSEGILLQGPSSIYLDTTWRGSSNPTTGERYPGYGTGGILQVYYDPGDIVSWNFSYYAGA